MGGAMTAVGATAMASTPAVTATIAVGSAPQGVAVEPGTRTVYVTNFNSNTVSVIDGVANTVTATIPVGTRPVGVAVDPGTRIIYVANDGSNTVPLSTGLRMPSPRP